MESLLIIVETVIIWILVSQISDLKQQRAFREKETDEHHLRILFHTI